MSFEPLETSQQELDGGSDSLGFPDPPESFPDEPI
jgi:hypothetical protein